jgi:Hg(II)-responsive transcriptional regulator
MNAIDLRIGEVARRAKVNLQTIRYYERTGLLPKAPRTASNYRVYSGESVRRVRFIKRAQDLGFTLKEIKELLSLRARPSAKCTDALARAEAKIENIDEKIRTLNAMRRALSTLMSECKGRGTISECPILDVLADDEP